jgi:hypothetical protein
VSSLKETQDNCYALGYAAAMREHEPLRTAVRAWLAVPSIHDLVRIGRTYQPTRRSDDERLAVAVADALDELERRAEEEHPR